MINDALDCAARSNSAAGPSSESGTGLRSTHSSNEAIRASAAHSIRSAETPASAADSPAALAETTPRRSSRIAARSPDTTTPHGWPLQIPNITKHDMKLLYKLVSIQGTETEPRVTDFHKSVFGPWIQEAHEIFKSLRTTSMPWTNRDGVTRLLDYLTEQYHTNCRNQATNFRERNFKFVEHLLTTTGGLLENFRPKKQVCDIVKIVCSATYDAKDTPIKWNSPEGGDILAENPALRQQLQQFVEQQRSRMGPLPVTDTYLSGSWTGYLPRTRTFFENRESRLGEKGTRLFHFAPHYDHAKAPYITVDNNILLNSILKKRDPADSSRKLSWNAFKRRQRECWESVFRLDKVYRPALEFHHMIRTDGVGAAVVFRVASKPRRATQVVDAGQQGTASQLVRVAEQGRSSSAIPCRYIGNISNT